MRNLTFEAMQRRAAAAAPKPRKAAKGTKPRQLKHETIQAGWKAAIEAVRHEL